jgi:tetratricopeptide (TPR) repeat protein
MDLNTDCIIPMPRQSVTACLVFCVCLCIAPTLIADPAPDPAHIEKLVKQLGDDDWRKRERASEELKRIGLSARETLMALSSHADSEVAARVRRLLEEMPWAVAGEDDTEAVELLQNFAHESEAQRRNTLHALTLLGAKKNLQPLLRIARFFPSEQIAFAAVAAIELTAARTFDADETNQIAKQALESRVAPSRPALALLIAWAQNTTGNPEASATLEKVIAMETERLSKRAEPDSGGDARLRELKTRLAKWRLAEGKTDDCVRLFAELARSEPDNSNFELLLCELLLEANRPKELLAAFESFKPRAKEERILLYAKAAARRALNQLDEAQKAADAVFAREASPALRMETADALIRFGRADWAMREYERLTKETEEQGRTHHRALLQLARLASDTKQFERAAQLYGKAAQLSAQLGDNFHFSMTEDDFKLLAKIAEIRRLASKGDTDRIKPLLDEIAAAAPSDFDVAIELCNVFTEHNRAEAATVTKTVSERLGGEGEETAAEFANNLAWFLARTNQRLDEALKLAERAVKLDPDQYAYLDTLAEVHFRLGNVDKAIRLSTRALELAPNDPVIAAQLRRFKTETPPR